MANPEKIKHILLSEIEKMDQHREDFCKRPGIDFTRDRKITFGTLLHFQISMESGSLAAASEKKRFLTSGWQGILPEAIQKRNACIPNQQTSTGTSAKRWL